MKKTLISIVLCCLLQLPLWSQNYIGMTKDQLKQEVEKNTSFNLDESVKNDKHNYLKFVDNNNEETWLFFLDENDVCLRHKIMSDYSNLETRIKEYDKKYKKAIKDTWVFTDDGGTYKVEIKRDEWFFSVSTIKMK